jgi:cytochrome c oxidase subunit 2
VSLVRVGAQAAGELGCLRCHTLDGSPHIGPTWAGLYRSIVPLQGGGSVIADEAYLTESMMDPMVRLHAGFQAVMPSYHGLVTPGQTAAILELIKAVREVPGRGTKLAPLEPGASVEAPPGAERAGAEEPARVETPASPETQQGLPPPGFTPLPRPRLPIRVGAPGTPPVAGPDGGQP